MGKELLSLEVYRAIKQWQRNEKLTPVPFPEDVVKYIINKNIISVICDGAMAALTKKGERAIDRYEVAEGTADKAPDISWGDVKRLATWGRPEPYSHGVRWVYRMVKSGYLAQPNVMVRWTLTKKGQAVDDRYKAYKAKNKAAKKAKNGEAAEADLQMPLTDKTGGVIYTLNCTALQDGEHFKLQHGQISYCMTVDIQKMSSGRAGERIPPLSKCYIAADGKLYKYNPGGAGVDTDDEIKDTNPLNHTHQKAESQATGAEPHAAKFTSYKVYRHESIKGMAPNQSVREGQEAIGEYRTLPIAIAQAIESRLIYNNTNSYVFVGVDDKGDYQVLGAGASFIIKTVKGMVSK